MQYPPINHGDLLSTSPTSPVNGGRGPNLPPLGNSPNTSNNNSSAQPMSILFDENALIPTKRIDIRRHEPQPFKERYAANLHHLFGGGGIFIPILFIKLQSGRLAQSLSSTNG